MSLLVTNAGLEALVNAEQTGTEEITITSIQIGSGQYTPSATQTALQTPIKTLTAISGGAVSAHTLHVTVTDESTDAYTVNELGVFLSDGTLFAVTSQNTPILQKAADSIALLAIDINLADHSAATVIVGDTNFFNPPATTTVKGVVELATVEETSAGIDNERVVTPATLSAATAWISGALDTKAPNNHASTATTYGIGTSENYGHVKLSDSAFSTSGASAGVAASPAAVKTAYDQANKMLPLAGGTMSGTIVSTAGRALSMANSDASISDENRDDTSQRTFFVCDDKDGKIAGSLKVTFETDGGRTTQLIMRNRWDTSWIMAGLKEDSNGNSFMFSPTPPTAASDNEVTTAAWVRSFGGNYLPRAGGQMTNSLAVMRDVSNSYLGLYGGTGEKDGAQLDLCGKDHASIPGGFQLHARNSDTDIILRGQTDGTLRWNTAAVLTNSFSMSGNTSGIVLNSGTDYASGAYLRLYGKDRSSDPGKFLLTATNGTNTAQLVGTPNGDLTWNSNKVITSAGGEMTGGLVANNNANLVKLVNGAVAIGDTSRSSASYSNLAVAVDKNGKRGGGVEVAWDTNGARSMYFSMRTRTDSTYLTMGVVETKEGHFYAQCNNSQVFLPAGAVFAYAGNSTPNGCLLCSGAAVSRTTYAALFNVIGTTYGSGDGSTTFNLPDLRGKFIQGAWSSDRGATKNAGLPAISAWWCGTYEADSGVGTDGWGNGAVTSGWDGNNPMEISGTAGGGKMNYWFDANKCSGLYGASTTVQPPAVAMYYFIKY